LLNDRVKVLLDVSKQWPGLLLRSDAGAAPTAVPGGTVTALAVPGPALMALEQVVEHQWASALGSPVPLSVTLVIEDLQDGELAEARATQFDPNGRPIGGVIVIDPTAAGYGWFIDATPQDASEFDARGGRLTARPGTDAAGRYDLYTVLLH